MHTLHALTSKAVPDASFPTNHPVSNVGEKCITKIVSRFPFFVEKSPLFSEQSPPFFNLLKSLFFPSRHVMLFPGWGGCRGSAGRPGGGWPAPAAKQLARIGRYRDMQLAEPTRWAEGVAAGAAACVEWSMVNPSASEPADDSAAHFQIDCKSTREAGASWNEATGLVDMTRLGAMQRCRSLTHGSASVSCRSSGYIPALQVIDSYDKEKRFCGGKRSGMASLTFAPSHGERERCDRSPAARTPPSSPPSHPHRAPASSQHRP